jgi:YVTN family beta-propeller protein
MSKYKIAWLLAAVLIIVVCHSTMAREDREERGPGTLMVDEPGEEDMLNRELWHLAKKTPYEDAERHLKKVQQEKPAPPAEVVLPTGWKIAPAGRQVEVGRFPATAVFYAGHIVVLNNGYYLLLEAEKEHPKEENSPEISVVDPASGQVVKVLRPGSLFPSAVVGLDGNLYISGGYDQVVYCYNDKFELQKKLPVNGYAAGLAPLDADHLAVVYLVAESAPPAGLTKRYGRGKLAILNARTEAKSELEASYFPHTVRFQDGKLYVSILGEDKLNVYDYETGTFQAKLKTSLAVGQTPQDICPDPDGHRLYVVNTGSDYLSVVDTRHDEVEAAVDVSSHGYAFGSGPTSCAVQGDRLFVTQAYTNAVGVFAKKGGQRLGFIPTGWFPTKVLAQKDWLAVLSAKGIKGRRPNVTNSQKIKENPNAYEYVLTLLKGTLGILPTDQIEPNLPAWTTQVEEGVPLYCTPQGMKLPIRYVFFIVRENRTYDQVLGDLTWANCTQRGNGDPYLTLFGQKITPNGHQLAKKFITLDNYYADGEISVLGHSFTTSGYASPFLEWLANNKYANRYDNYPFGMVPAVFSPNYFWDALDAKGVDYRIYGENYFLYTRAFRLIQENFGPDSDQAKKFYARMMGLAVKVDRGNELFHYAALFRPQPRSVAEAEQLLLWRPEAAPALSKFLLGDDSLIEPLRTNQKLRREFAAYLYHYPISYRSWDLMYSDLDRVRAWRADFDSQVKRGSVARFHYLWLPNDHTAGANPRTLTPYQFVAQNDAALGLIIHTICQHQDIWKQSLILITEDDAQNGPDHVDATRTVGLAVGPWVKRNVVVSDRYDQLSMLRTMELLLGLDPLNQNDGLAVPMFSIFRDHPDYTPYKLVPPSTYLVDADKMKYKRLLADEKKPPCHQP